MENSIHVSNIFRKIMKTKVGISTLFELVFMKIAVLKKKGFAVINILRSRVDKIEWSFIDYELLIIPCGFMSTFTIHPSGDLLAMTAHIY
jgi:hypothetical protein